MPSVYNTVFGGAPVAPAIPTYLSLVMSTNQVLGWPLESNITSPAAAAIVDVSATAPALTVQLSDARQVGNGTSILFNNVGVNTFTVLDAQGNTLAAPLAGAAWLLYLADNSTLQGTWRAFQYGASVSSANAAALAGAGLKAISTTLNDRIFINAQAVNYTIGTGTSQDRAACVEWTGGSGGTFTSLTAAVLGSDWFCYIKNGGTGVLTFTPGSGTVNGTASLSFNPNDSAILLTDGTNFFTVGFGQAVASSFNFVTISLAGASGTVVLTGAQLNRISYKFTGALAGNTVVQIPASIQQYWVDNETTGAFSLTISAGGAGSTFVVPQTTRVILYCDGLNVVNAVSAGTGGITLVADGTAAAPGLAWASDTQMGFYKPGTDTLGISTAGTARGSINATGQWTINAPSGGASLTINGISASAQPQLSIVGGTNGSASIILTDGQVGNRQWVIEDGNPAVGNLRIRDATAGADRVVIGNTGGVTINTPSAGTSLTIGATGAASTGGISITATAGNFSLIQFAGNGNTLGSSDVFVGQLGNSNGALINRANAGLVLGANNTTVVTISAAGNVTVSAPSSGISLTVNGPATNYGLYVQASTTSGQSFGEIIHAGTTSGDFALRVQNAAASADYFQVRGDGKLLGEGPIAGAVVDMTPDASTFPGTWNGFSAAPATTTIPFVRMGNLVTITFPGSNTGTSNAANFSLSGLPASLQPAHGQCLPLLGLIDNGAAITTGYAQINASSGTISFGKSFTSGSPLADWTGSGTKGFSANSTGYTLTYSIG